MGGGSSSDDEGAITGINVTPFVDIALVLLIIFMVTAKYIVTPQTIPVDLPRASSSGPTQVTAMAISVNQNGDIFVDGRAVNEDGLLAYARQKKSENPEVRAIIAADQRVPHGRVVRVIDIVRRAQVAKFAIQTQPEVAAQPVQ
ncbi:MAG: biopolymer transporter ExbD [Polyangiales bacterium]